MSHFRAGAWESEVNPRAWFSGNPSLGAGKTHLGGLGLWPSFFAGLGLGFLAFRWSGCKSNPTCCLQRWSHPPQQQRVSSFLGGWAEKQAEICCLPPKLSNLKECQVAFKDSFRVHCTHLGIKLKPPGYAPQVFLGSSYQVPNS